ncbi:MAG: hypothetical protein QXN68_02690 [Thermoplasmata archaeon]
MDVDLNHYDVIIATPPCNFWSRANYRRYTSLYSQQTKHLLNDIIDKCIDSGKPFIIENVRNKKMFTEYGLYNKWCIIFEHGRHTYWTNVAFEYKDIPIENDFKATNKRIKGKRGWYLTPDGKEVRSAGQVDLVKDRQGGKQVHDVIERFLLELKKHKLNK